MKQDLSLILKKAVTENSNSDLSSLLQEVHNFIYENKIVDKISRLTAEEKKEFIGEIDKGKTITIDFSIWISNELKGYLRDGIISNFSCWSLTIDNFEKYRYCNCNFIDRLGFNLNSYSDIPIELEVPILNSVIEIEKHIKYNLNIEYINSNAGFLFGNERHKVHRIRFKPKDLEIVLNKIKVEFINRLRNTIILLNTDVDNSNLELSEIDKLKILIQNDDIEEAIIKIRAKDQTLENDALLLLSKLSSIRKQLINGIIRNEDYQLEMNKIKFATISLLDNFKNE